MKIHNLGYPRIGSKRQLKKACENYWSGLISEKELLQVGELIRKSNWKIQKAFSLDLIPINDFSFYDHVLDMSFLLGVIPDRYHLISESKSSLELYFSMARGYQKDGIDVVAMEMKKWFDTNYHYIVPEFQKEQKFKLFGNKIFNELQEAKEQKINFKPVLIGPISYLLLGKKDKKFSRLNLISNLLPIYIEILQKLEKQGALWVQIDEPFLMTDLTQSQKEIYKFVYSEIKKHLRNLNIILVGYFGSYQENLELALSLPVNILHLDLTRSFFDSDFILNNHKIINSKILSLGIIDGRNIWKNNFKKSLCLIEKFVNIFGDKKIWIAPSCSLLHVPYDLNNEKNINLEIKEWLAFAKQKISELMILSKFFQKNKSIELEKFLNNNININESRKTSKLIHNLKVKDRINSIDIKDFERNSKFNIRQKIQKNNLKLPLFPTTTIGSFPQTNKLRKLRSQFKKNQITKFTYEENIKKEIIELMSFQENLDLDVLVHGEFERNDMVEYFGELLNGFVFTENGWVQSYGSRCVKPPIIFGDVFRSHSISVYWINFAQKYTKKIVKGMLTGPVTILQWSFVRDDQPRSITAYQIALAIRDEVCELEKSGIKIIQIDEPAIREGLPLRKKEWKDYLDWAVKAFRLSSSSVQDYVQIHTHMCYSDFNDIIEYIAKMDADVITIETSRSAMKILNIFQKFKYPNEIGPGVYDIHSPRVPSVREIVFLLDKAIEVLPVENIWVNPDCGLKTRKWEETELSLKNMVEAAKIMRNKIKINNI